MEELSIYPHPLLSLNTLGMGLFCDNMKVLIDNQKGTFQLFMRKKDVSFFHFDGQTLLVSMCISALTFINRRVRATLSVHVICNKKLCSSISQLFERFEFTF